MNDYDEPQLDVPAILEEVAGTTGVSVEAILGKDRAWSVVEARWIAVHTLARCGLATAAIGRALNRDHSTILHGKVTAAKHPEWDAVADRILARCNAPGLSLADQLFHVLQVLPAGQHAAVAAFVSCTVLHHEALPSPICMNGMRHLANHERARHQVQDALWRHDYRGHAGSIDRYIRAAGYRLIGTAWRAPNLPSAPLLLAAAETLLLEENPPMSKVELIDPSSIPAAASARDRESRLADARLNLRQAHSAGKALKLNLDADERSAPIVSAYAAAAKLLGLNIRCNLDGSREYVGLGKKTRTDATTVYVRILGGKLQAVAS